MIPREAALAAGSEPGAVATERSSSVSGVLMTYKEMMAGIGVWVSKTPFLSLNGNTRAFPEEREYRAGIFIK